MTGRVVEGHERVAGGPSPALEIASDLVMPAGVAVLVLQSPEDPGGGVPLLARGGPVGLQDGVHQRG